MRCASSAQNLGYRPRWFTAIHFRGPALACEYLVKSPRSMRSCCDVPDAIFIEELRWAESL